VILDLLATGAMTLTSVRLWASTSRRRITKRSSPGPAAGSVRRSRPGSQSWRRDPMSHRPYASFRDPGRAHLAGNLRPEGDQRAWRTGRCRGSSARPVRSGTPSDRPGHGAAAVPGAVHHRPGDPRQASAGSGPPPP
jgi:hypothetical protein